MRVLLQNRDPGILITKRSAETVAEEDGVVIFDIDVKEAGILGVKIETAAPLSHVRRCRCTCRETQTCNTLLLL